MVAAVTALAPMPWPGPWPGVCNRCGSCCRCFYLPHNPPWFDGTWTEGADGTRVDYGEILIPLRPVRDARGRFWGGWWYTCRWFAEDAGDGLPGCTMHEQRPAHMCGDYPYNSTTQTYKGCTWYAEEDAR